MGIYQNPFFRKTIVAWYDSDTFCIVTILLLIPVFLFGLIGWHVAQGHPAYHAHLWVPALLTALSATVIVKTVIRMLRRR